MTTPDLAAIVRPFSVAQIPVTSAMICAAIDLIANLPPAFKASFLHPAFFPDGDPFPHASSEASNRLMQRWRGMGLCSFKGGRWRLATGAWALMQSAASKSPETNDEEK